VKAAETTVPAPETTATAFLGGAPIVSELGRHASQTDEAPGGHLTRLKQIVGRLRAVGSTYKP